MNLELSENQQNVLTTALLTYVENTIDSYEFIDNPDQENKTLNELKTAEAILEQLGIDITLEV